MEEIKRQKYVMEAGKTGIVYDDNYTQSLFSSVYKRAAQLTYESADNQRKLMYNKEIRDQPNNIITFIGRRGTGKSSAMVSFMEGLKNNFDSKDSDKQFKNELKKEAYFKDEIRFIGLEWIDAALLEPGEDIFESILAKMFGEFMQRENRDYDRNSHRESDTKELYRRFESIYKMVMNLKVRNHNTSMSFERETALSNLRDIARSTDLRREFERLVNLYIKVMRSNSVENYYEDDKNTFLVVAIDDVDMNIKNGFKILEDILRYLRINRLIVLMAVNYEQMHHICEKHFSNTLVMYDESDDYKKDYISKLTMQYMEKALPSHMRIYLPSLKKMDYDRSVDTEIQYKEGDTIIMLPIKQAIFRLAYKKLMFIYDPIGRKRHFVEPDTLRNMSHYHNFLMDLDDIDFDIDNDIDAHRKFILKFDINIKRSMDDILFRYAYENLSDKERNLFIECSEVDIGRRGEMIISNFLTNLSKSNTAKDYMYLGYRDAIESFKKDYEEFQYSYGELMRAFYVMGRSSIYKKKLIHAFLAMYNNVLTKIFYRYKEYRYLCKKIESGTNEFKALKDNTKNNYNKMKEIMGNSVAGSGSNLFMPICEEMNSGAIKGVELENLIICESKAEDRNIDKEKFVKNTDYRRNSIKSRLEEMRPIAIIMLFFSDFCSDTDYSREYTFNYNESNGDVKISRCRANFNVLNFVNSIFAFEELYKTFVYAVEDLIIQENSICGFSDKGKDTDVEEIIKEFCDKEGFYNEMVDWTDKYGGMVLPVYATDFYYNMLKRMSRDFKSKTKSRIEKDELFSTFLKLLDYIQSYLYDVEKKYTDEGKTSLKYKYSDIFAQCPVIKYFGDYSKDETDHRPEDASNDIPKIKFNKEFSELYNEVVYRVIYSQKNNENGDVEHTVKNSSQLISDSFKETFSYLSGKFSADLKIEESKINDEEEESNEE